LHRFDLDRIDFLNITLGIMSLCILFFGKLEFDIITIHRINVAESRGGHKLVPFKKMQHAVTRRLKSRVTRLGVFSSMERVLILGSFWKITRIDKILGLLFSTDKVIY
jgi:hypothetical protein